MDSILKFAEKVSALKRLNRTGWVIKGVCDSESVAEHSFMLAILAYLYAKKFGLDENKCIKMALIHDICEVYSGDVPNRPFMNDKERKAKKAKERIGIRKISLQLPYSFRKEFLSLWDEFEKGKTAETKLVADLDKLEMCMQALAYARDSKPKERRKFAEFFEDGKRNIKDIRIKKIFEELCREFERLVPEK